MQNNTLGGAPTHGHTLQNLGSLVRNNLVHEVRGMEGVEPKILVDGDAALGQQRIPLGRATTPYQLPLTLSPQVYVGTGEMGGRGREGWGELRLISRAVGRAVGEPVFGGVVEHFCKDRAGREQLGPDVLAAATQSRHALEQLGIERR